MCFRYILDKIQTCSPSLFVTPLNSKKKKNCFKCFYGTLKSARDAF